MALIVNESQFLRKGVTYPRGVYSRQIGLEIIVPAGAEGYNYTEPLADRLWLLGVDYYGFTGAVGAVVGMALKIVSCQGPPASVADILVNLPAIIPCRGTKPYMFWWRVEQGHMHWSMNKYYNEPGQRFACAMDNTLGTVQWNAHVFFQISEG